MSVYRLANTNNWLSYLWPSPRRLCNVFQLTQGAPHCHRIPAREKHHCHSVMTCVILICTCNECSANHLARSRGQSLHAEILQVQGVSASPIETKGTQLSTGKQCQYVKKSYLIYTRPVVIRQASRHDACLQKIPGLAFREIPKNFDDHVAAVDFCAGSCMSDGELRVHYSGLILEHSLK